MAKRNRSITPNTNKRKLAQKRGIGRLADYKPWNTIQDTATQSLVTRIKGWKTGRIHHILSQLQLSYFYLLEWSLSVIDIREQYPLDQPEVLAVAEEICAKHFLGSANKENLIITTDFLITTQSGFGTKEIARTVVNSNFLANPRTAENLEIQRRYWQFRDIDWGVVTERNINNIQVNNIKWFHSFLESTCLEPVNPEQINQAEAIMLKELVKENLPLRDATFSCDEELNFPPGTALSIVRHLIAVRRWQIDINVPVQPEKPLSITSTTTKGGKQ